MISNYLVNAILLTSFNPMLSYIKTHNKVNSNQDYLHKLRKTTFIISIFILHYMGLCISVQL